MLTQLHLHNLAVVSEAELTLAAGMTAISGETGAGKSLLVDALLLLTGARAQAQMVRHGAERAQLEGEFDLADAPAAVAWLRENELDDADEPRVCRLRRVIRADGGSRAWINGHAASAVQLRELGERLVEIHGQHEHQALLARTEQRALLDAFGQHAALCEPVRALADRWRGIERRLATQGDPTALAQRLDELDRQLAALDRHDIDPDAITEMLVAHDRQTHAAQLLEGSARVLAQLEGDDGVAIDRALAQIHTDLHRLGAHDDAYAQAAVLVEAANVQLAEASRLIERARDGIDIDPQRLRALEDERVALHELARRHRVPLEGLAEVRAALLRERDGLRDAGDGAQQTLAEREATAAAWRVAADALSASRHASARTLGETVTALMAELGMPGGRLHVALEAVDATTPSPCGSEQVEFLIAANPGQPPQPLRKVASGGELSRIALAIEVAALGMDAVPTMVFDEVDSGIGGAVAEVVGRKLRTLGSQRQVLCVTHLPQVAAQAHRQVRVRKDSDGSTTRSAVQTLDHDARVDEIARMLGGIAIGDEALAHARQMLADAGEAR